MNSDERDLLVEAATTAKRPPDPSGELRFHPAFFDLDPAGREALFAATAAQRRLEAAVASSGLSSTARAVLARLGMRA